LLLSFASSRIAIRVRTKRRPKRPAYRAEGWGRQPMRRSRHMARVNAVHCRAFLMALSSLVSCCRFCRCRKFEYDREGTFRQALVVRLSSDRRISMNWRLKISKLRLEQTPVASDIIAMGSQADNVFVYHRRHPLTVVTAFSDHVRCPRGIPAPTPLRATRGFRSGELCYKVNFIFCSIL
jgi:hypothetical protein